MQKSRSSMKSALIQAGVKIKIYSSSQAALITTLQVRLEQKDGDILVFLTGQEDIETLEQLLNDYARRLPKHAKKLLVRPIFAAMPSEQQILVFDKVVV